MKRFACVLLSLCCFISSTIIVSASESGYETFSVQTFALADPEKDQTIMADNMEFVVLEQAYMNVIDRGTIVWGATAGAYHNPPDSNINSIEAVIENYTDTLFTIPGTFRLRMLTICSELKISVYRRGAAVEKYTINPADYPSYIIDFTFNNFDADIYRVDLSFLYPIYYEGMDQVACAITYGYDSSEQTVQDAVKDAADSVVNRLTAAIKDVVSGLFGVNSSTENNINNSNNKIESTTSEIFGLVGNIDSITFDDSIFNIAGVQVTLEFISSFLLLLFTKLQFSVVFYFTCTLLLAAILLGFARHWKGGK